MPQEHEEETAIGQNALFRSDIGLSTHMGGSDNLTVRSSAQKHARAERRLTRIGPAIRR